MSIEQEAQSLRSYLMWIAIQRGVRIAEDREDVVQAAIIKAVATYDPAKGSVFRTHLINSVHQRSWEWVRANTLKENGGRRSAPHPIHLEEMTYEVPNDGGFDSLFDEIGFKSKMRQMGKVLSPKHMRALAVVFAGGTKTEAARVLGCSTSNVNHMFKKIQAVFEGLE